MRPLAHTARLDRHVPGEVTQRALHEILQFLSLDVSGWGRDSRFRGKKERLFGTPGEEPTGVLANFHRFCKRVLVASLPLEEFR